MFLYLTYMTGQEETEWQHIHRKVFSNPDKAQGERTLADWYEEEFAAPDLLMFRCPGWPTGADAWGSSLNANIMVANVDPFIHAMLFADTSHSTHVTLAGMKTWNEVIIYQAMRSISNSGVYKAAMIDRSKLTHLSAAVETVAALAVAAKANAQLQLAAPTLPSTSVAPGQLNWSDLTSAQKAVIHSKYLAMEQANPIPVPGADGKINYNIKGKPQWCFRWSDDSGCHHQGHKYGNCPFGGKPPPPGSTPHLAPSAAPPVPMALAPAPAATITESTLKDLFAALADIGGTDSDVAAIAKKYLDKP
jgi:hypothetical protein